MLVRKIGAPGQPELALGAIVDGATPVVLWNDDIVRSLGIGHGQLEALAQQQRAVLADRRQLYAGHRPAVPAVGRTVVVVESIVSSADAGGELSLQAPNRPAIVKVALVSLRNRIFG